MSWSELLCLSPFIVCVGILYVFTIFHKSNYPTKAPPGYHFEWGVGLVHNDYSPWTKEKYLRYYRRLKKKKR